MHVTGFVGSKEGAGEGSTVLLIAVADGNAGVVISLVVEG